MLLSAARNIQHVDGNSPYKRRHRTGKCQAIEIPFGALILYAPTPTASKAPGFAPKNHYGLMLGYDVHPGGLWAGRYRVLSWEKMRENPELTPNKAIIQYVDSVSHLLRKSGTFR